MTMQLRRFCPCGNEPMRGNDRCWVCVRQYINSSPENPDPVMAGGTLPVVSTVSAPHRIKQEVCREFGLTMGHLMGRGNNTTWVVKARRKAARRMREELHMSYPDIGRFLSRHHTTIIALLAKHHQILHTAAKAVSK